MKHKHYDLILAWANGAKIEQRNYDDYGGYSDFDWFFTTSPNWNNQDSEFRIKPEPQKEQEPQYLYVYRHIDTSKIMMSPTLLRETSEWTYLGKVRVEK